MTILRRNYIANILDGGFFGMALGFASFVTILPLFVSRFTDSAVLIGLIPVMHVVGWQLPQLFTADWISRQSRYKPLVITLTVQERLPFLGMAFIAWFSPRLPVSLVLVLVFLMLAWQGLGAGFTANPWQSMIAKIIPSRQRGTFFGLQASASNLLFSVGAIVSGILLQKLDSPLDFTLCFLIASFIMVFSYISLSLTHEEASVPHKTTTDWLAFWKSLIAILRKERNFSYFLLTRTLFQFATMAFAFYIVYGVQRFGMSDGLAGVMASVLAGVQILANPIMGWLGDHWSHRLIMVSGCLAAILSAVCALLAPTLSWFYAVFILAGIANVTIWTIGMTMTLEFGSEAERPAYIGLSNTLSAPGGILAPLFGGWLADRTGYLTTFSASAIFGLVTVLALLFLLRDPRSRPQLTFEPDEINPDGTQSA